ncbi:MAG: glycosyltransferase family 39 protein [Pseudomonadota bacterium]|nr:glycosyltransferase family 39 protein [Pseudomonadota bacterium]
MSSLIAFLNTLSLHQKVLIGLFVLLKIALILMVPLTGDEAYFITWGQNLSLGYYDHPPAVGWVLYAMGQVTDNLVWYRSFAFFSAVLIAYLIYKLVRMDSRVSQTIAFWVALAFFVSPISLMFVVTANDTVLALFSVLGVYFFAKAMHSQSWLDVVLAGLFLGLAFLSKYFAAFMLLGLLAYSLWYWKKLNLKQVWLMVAIVLLAVVENLYFNATHCWNNILFNFFSRTEASQFDIGNVLTYIGMIVLLLSPMGLWYLLKARNKTTESLNPYLNPIKLVVFASIPLLGILFLVSLTNAVGLHWPLISVTLLYVLYLVLSEQQLKRLVTFNAYFSIVAAVILLVALSMVDQLISPSQKHHVAVYTQPEKVCAFLPKDQPFYTLGYSSQSALAYHCGNDNVHVFASTSKFGREDDKLTDFKALNGKTLTILITHEKDANKVSPFFTSLHVKPLAINEETTYYLIEGKGFNYGLYRDQVLIPVNEKFYSAPDWFPAITGGCDFKKKYDFD